MTARAQGNTRKMPDGLLHLQNFTVTKDGGIAGFLFAKVMTKAQRDIVELCLIQKLTTNGYCSYPPHLKVSTWNEAHQCHRFPKGFLKAQFHKTVYSVYEALGRCPRAEFNQALSNEKRDREI